MPRTHSSYQQDTGFSDAKIVVHPIDIAFSGTAVITRNAANDWSLNQAASLTVNYAIPVSKMIERVLAADDLQEVFGTATPTNAGGAVVYSATQSSPADVTGRPPFTGQSFLSPVLQGRPKGFKLTDITLVYQITTLALTTHTLGIAKIPYANNVALAPVVVLAVAANGLQTAVQANPYVTKVNVGANALFNVTDNQEVMAELQVITPATSTYRLYRAILHGTFNHN